MKALREAAGVRQDDVATAARACGLSWGRSTVAMLESGKRRLDPEELLLLPVVLQVAQVGSFPLVQLLAGDDDMVHLTAEAAATRAELETLLDPAGGPAALDLQGWKMPGVLSGAQVMEAAAERARWRRRGLTAEQVEVATREAAGEAERVAARKLGVTPYEVAVAARKLWGRSLSAVRDERAAAGADELPTDSLRAMRGHVTRQLLAELAPILEQEADQ